jgi:hypothetical protein
MAAKDMLELSKTVGMTSKPSATFTLPQTAWLCCLSPVPVLWLLKGVPHAQMHKSP